MVTTFRQKWCEHEQKYVLAKSDEVWHYLHGLISIGTFGLWLPVWLVLALRADARYFCPECGRPTREPEQSANPEPRTKFRPVKAPTERRRPGK